MTITDCNIELFSDQNNNICIQAKSMQVPGEAQT